MRPKLKEEDSEITKMSIFMLNYYQDAEAHIDNQQQQIKELKNELDRAYISLKECGYTDESYTLISIKQALKK